MKILFSWLHSTLFCSINTSFFPITHHIYLPFSLSLIEHENGSGSTIDSQESVQHATFNLLDDAKGYVKEQAHA
jgi:hypothetical protein